MKPLSDKIKVMDFSSNCSGVSRYSQQSEHCCGSGAAVVRLLLDMHLFVRNFLQDISQSGNTDCKLLYRSCCKRQPHIRAPTVDVRGTTVCNATCKPCLT